MKQTKEHQNRKEITEELNEKIKKLKRRLRQLRPHIKERNTQTESKVKTTTSQTDMTNLDIAQLENKEETDITQLTIRLHKIKKLIIENLEVTSKKCSRELHVSEEQVGNVPRHRLSTQQF